MLTIWNKIVDTAKQKGHQQVLDQVLAHGVVFVDASDVLKYTQRTAPDDGSTSIGLRTVSDVLLHYPTCMIPPAQTVWIEGTLPSKQGDGSVSLGASIILHDFEAVTHSGFRWEYRVMFVSTFSQQGVVSESHNGNSIATIRLDGDGRYHSAGWAFHPDALTENMAGQFIPVMFETFTRFYRSGQRVYEITPPRGVRRQYERKVQKATGKPVETCTFYYVYINGECAQQSYTLPQVERAERIHKLRAEHGVRGHWRFLQSGKVVWIKPYRRGGVKTVRQGVYKVKGE